jgi:hypothetical protein
MSQDDETKQVLADLSQAARTMAEELTKIRQQFGATTSICKAATSQAFDRLWCNPGRDCISSCAGSSIQRKVNNPTGISDF